MTTRLAGYSALTALVLLACSSETAVGRATFSDPYTDGAVVDGAAVDAASADAGACTSGAVSHVVARRGPPAERVDAAVSPPLVSGGDGGLFFAIPDHPCDGPEPAVCPNGPRQIFSCPTLSVRSGGTKVTPGAVVSVDVPITSEGLAAYACMGLSGDLPLVAESDLFYAVEPAYVRVSGQVAPSTKPGTVIHFTAMGNGNPCPNDLRVLDFDVTVE